MIIIPLSTDAPLYHRPYGTWALMGLSVLISLLIWTGLMSRGVAEALFVLQHGTINPLQWIGSIFTHAGFLHLAGNLIFLAVFGLIVEGKLGNGRFLALVAALAGLEGLVEQVLFIGASDGGSIGISSVIFGLMVISLFWAPRNQVDMFVLLGIWGFNFEVTIFSLCCWYVGWDVLALVLLMWSGEVMSTPFLHVLGAAVAIPFAIMSLRHNWVDCEGWDLLTIRERVKAGERVDATALNKAHREATQTIPKPSMPEPKHNGPAAGWMDNIGKTP